MADSHFIVEKLLEFHIAGEIMLPPKTKAFVSEMWVKARAVPPDLTLTEATVLEVLWKTYMRRS